MITHKFFHTFTFKHNQETIFMCNLSVFKAASIALHLIISVFPRDLFLGDTCPPALAKWGTPG